MKGYESGSVTYDESSKTLSLNNAVVSGDIIADIGITIKLSGNSTVGKIQCKDLTISGSGKMTLVGASKSDYTDAVECGALRMTGGTISSSNCYYGVDCTSLSMTGGSIRISNCNSGVDVGTYDHKTHVLSIKGGTIAVSNPSGVGIRIHSGNFAMSGGTVQVTGSYGDGIEAYSDTSSGTTYGGRVIVKGGSLTATVRDVKSYSAIYGDSMTNTIASLKSIKGRLPKGARFKVDGNIYQIRSYNETILTLYGSPKTAYSFNRTVYGSYVYYIYGVGANAFNTYRGRRVRNLAFANRLNYLGAGAFKNTISLTSIKLSLDVRTRWANKRWYTSRYDTARFSSVCFAGMGKSRGAGLTVRIGYSDQSSAYRAFMRKYGLPAGTKVARRS